MMDTVGSSRRYTLPAAIVIAAGCILIAGCNRQLLSLLVDLPAAAPSVPEPVVETPQEDAGTPMFIVPADTVRPLIEGTLDPDSAVVLLPKDAAGNIDWMEALETGVIKPRDFLPDSQPPVRLPGEFAFAFDFFFPGPSEMFDAFFPHSAHTEWVDCTQCHGRVFKYQDNEVTMAEILQGQWCGECHGKVAFPAVTGCERCHNSLPMPPGRAQPDLIGTITMQRFASADTTPAATQPSAVVDVPDSAESSDSAAVATNADSLGVGPVAPRATLGYVTDALPPSQFPHWVHRARYKCKVCHVQIFEPKAGANRVTMTDISNGEACGVCHDGVTAFAAGFNECQRCHVDPDPLPGSSLGQGASAPAEYRSGGPHGPP